MDKNPDPLFLPGEPGREGFHERHSLEPMVDRLRQIGTLRFRVIEISKLTYILHRTPSGGMMMSRSGRLFGLNSAVTDYKWNFTRTTLGGITQRIAESCIKFHRGSTEVSPIFFQEAWEEEAEYAIRFMKFERGYSLTGLKVCALDSYSAGNCLLGTRTFVNMMMPLGYQDAQFVYDATDLDYRDWEQDRMRAIAWAYASSKQAPL